MPKRVCMNVKRQSVWQRLKRSSFLISLLLLSINGAQNASADEFFLTSLWTDPLKSTPSILKDPQPLPGDDTSIQCNFNIEPNGILTLAKAIDITLCKNPQIKTEWTNIKIQAAAKGEASSAYLPTLSASVSKMHDETYYPGSQTPSTLNQSTGLYANLNWRIFDFGERKANYQAADALLQSAIFTLNATTQKTILSTIQSYFDALTALEVYNAKTHSMQLAYDTLSIVKKREAKGVASQSDTLQAITAYAKASLEMNRALGDFKKSKALLVYTLGLAANTPIQLDQSIDIKSGHEINELQRWLEETEKTHPAILAAKAQIDAAKLKIDATDSGGMPTLDLSGSFYQNGRPSQGMTPNRTQE